MTAAEIKALRRRLGLTQPQFATRLDGNAQAVYYWERGIRRPSGLYAKTLQDVARHADEHQASSLEEL